MTLDGFPKKKSTKSKLFKDLIDTITAEKINLTASPPNLVLSTDVDEEKDQQLGTTLTPNPLPPQGGGDENLAPVLEKKRLSSSYTAVSTGSSDSNHGISLAEIASSLKMITSNQKILTNNQKILTSNQKIIMSKQELILGYIKKQLVEIEPEKDTKTHQAEKHKISSRPAPSNAQKAAQNTNEQYAAFYDKLFNLPASQRAKKLVENSKRMQEASADTSKRVEIYFDMISLLSIIAPLQQMKRFQVKKAGQQNIFIHRLRNRRVCYGCIDIEKRAPV